MRRHFVIIENAGAIIATFGPFDDVYEAESWCDYDGADYGNQDGNEYVIVADVNAATES